jgi:hypothetical protein
MYPPVPITKTQQNKYLLLLLGLLLTKHPSRPVQPSSGLLLRGLGAKEPTRLGRLGRSLGTKESAPRTSTRAAQEASPTQPTQRRCRRPPEPGPKEASRSRRLGLGNAKSVWGLPKVYSLKTLIRSSQG